MTRIDAGNSVSGSILSSLSFGETLLLYSRLSVDVVPEVRFLKCHDVPVCVFFLF